jgi:DNA anti-recombination protein RmuC
LKGDSKIQGNWGEMILERVLEKIGFRKRQRIRNSEKVSSPKKEIEFNQTLSSIFPMVK